MTGRGLPRRAGAGFVAVASSLALFTAAPAGGSAGPVAHGALDLVIRVGGPSARHDPKIAVVGSRADLAGAHFRVLDDAGQIVLRGTLREAEGNPAPFAHAETADLSAVTAAGRYRVVVNGSRSAVWRVDAHGTRSYVDTMLNLFRANTDGDVRNRWHGPSHLNDKHTLVLNGPGKGRHYDLTGGWMDAGDQVKSTAGIAYSVMLLDEAARLDRHDRARIRSVTAVGLRFLRAAHPARHVFIAQVGDAVADHNTNAGPHDHPRDGVPAYFRRPELDDTRTVDVYGNRVSDRIRHRVAYATTDASMAGKVAAALAVAARTAAHPGRLLAAARDWYALGQAHVDDPRNDNEHVIYSGDSGAVDDLGTAAAALYETTGHAAYLHDAVRYLEHADLGAGPDQYATDPFGEAELCDELGGQPVPGRRDDQASPQGRACALLGEAARIARDRGRNNAFGSPGEFVWGHTCRSSGDADIALFGSHSGLTAHGAAVVAARARDYIFGLNPWGIAFIVGIRGGVRHPHHWAETLAAGQPLGALAGGPAAPGQFAGQGIAVPAGPFDSAQAVFADRMGDYVNTEPSIECQASGVLMLAMLAR